MTAHADRHAGPRGRWAALFPGQGSQSAGMGRDVAARWTEAADVFREADEVLGESLSGLCFEGPAEALAQTRNTQPALLTVSIAIWRVLEPRLGLPAVAAGHSLGEWSACVASGVLSFADALRAVRLRGEAMQEAVPVGMGAMAAVVGLDADRVEELCLSTQADGEVLVPANFNAPEQIVVAGHRTAVERLLALGRDTGAKRMVPLPVSAPFHSPLMAPAAERLEQHLRGLRFAAARFPIVSNVDARRVSGGDASRDALVRQVAAPVRWVETMRSIEHDDRLTLAAEVGAGRVLAGLSRRVNPDLRVLGCSTPDDVERALAELGAAMAQGRGE